MRCKYGILVYPNIPFFPDPGFQFVIDGNSRIVVEELEATVKDTHWKESIGALEWAKVSKGKIQVQLWYESSNPNVVDHENRELQIALDCYAKALMLNDLVLTPSSRPYVLTGTAEYDGQRLSPLDIRTYGKGPKWLRPAYENLDEYRESDRFNNFSASSRPKRYAEAFFTEWAKLYKEIRAVGADFEKNFLINIAIYSLQQALAEQFLDFGFPSLVRAIETLVALGPNQGRSFFARRARTVLPPATTLALTMDDKRIEEILRESYGLRSDTVHGKPLGHSLGSRRKHFFENEVKYYAYLLETVARRVIRAFLSDSALVEVAKDRKTLEEHWNRVDPPPTQTNCPSCKRPLQ